MAKARLSRRATAPNSQRGQENYLKPSRRTLAPPPLTERDTLVEHAVRWILRWTVRNYPGVRRGIVELFGGRASYSAIKGWRTGRRRMPADYAELLGRYIRTRAERGLELAKELDDYAAKRRAEPRRPRGFEVVRERDGIGSA